MKFKLLGGAAHFHVCNLLSAKNGVIVYPWRNLRSLNNSGQQGLKLTTANSLGAGLKKRKGREKKRGWGE